MRTYPIMLLALSMLSACNSATPPVNAATATEQIPTSTATNIAAPAPSPIAATNTTAPTPSPSATLSPTATMNFPGEQNLTIPLSEFFFAGFTNDCEFPCWYDLRLGESKPEDIQHFFDTVLGFNGTVDFWMPHPRVTVNQSLFLDPLEGYIGTGYQWLTLIDNENKPHIGIAAYLDEETELLEGIVILWGGMEHSYTDITPRKLFEQFGVPSTILIAPIDRVKQIVIIYDQGVVFHSFLASDTYCFDEASFKSEARLANFLITHPLAGRLDNLSILEERYFGVFIEADSLKYIEELTYTTPAEFTQDVLSGEDACLEFRD